MLNLFNHNAYCQEKLVTSLPVSSLSSYSLENKIPKEVSKYLGIPYRRGGSSRSGVDCSGFVRLIYKNIFRVDLPYIASYQSRLPIFENVSLRELRTGDLVFFSPITNKKRINHVGIYLSDSSFAHAIESKGVIISSLDNKYWKARVTSIKRIKSNDFL